MATLLLRLAGPMQSWGTQSRFTVRDTGMEPSRSGITGLLCAALGRPRDADLSDLARLRMGVRVDREGAVRRVYQTAGGSPRGENYGVATVGGKGLGVVLSNRYYLADAFMMAHPYGTVQLMSSYAFGSVVGQGPPSSSTGTTNAATCGSQWICEHRNEQVAGMVSFRNATEGTGISNQVTDGNGRLAFARGNRGYAAFNATALVGLAVS